MKANIVINEKDTKKIRIACRCGEKFIADIPEMFAHVLNAALCPKCRRIFGIQLQDEGWKIKPIEKDEIGTGVALKAEDLEDLKKQLPEEEKEKGWKN